MTMSPVMRWLTQGVPITLLCDLVDPDGPDSVVINAVEPPPSDPIWAEAAATAAFAAAVRATTARSA